MAQLWILQVIDSQSGTVADSRHAEAAAWSLELDMLVACWGWEGCEYRLRRVDVDDSTD